MPICRIKTTFSMNTFTFYFFELSRMCMKIMLLFTMQYLILLVFRLLNHHVVLFSFVKCSLHFLDRCIPFEIFMFGEVFRTIESFSFHFSTLTSFDLNFLHVHFGITNVISKYYTDGSFSLIYCTHGVARFQIFACLTSLQFMYTHAWPLTASSLVNVVEYYMLARIFGDFEHVLYWIRSKLLYFKLRLRWV